MLRFVIAWDLPDDPEGRIFAILLALAMAGEAPPGGARAIRPPPGL